MVIGASTGFGSEPAIAKGDERVIDKGVGWVWFWQHRPNRRRAKVKNWMGEVADDKEITIPL
jgi:hypothetical protein